MSNDTEIRPALTPRTATFEYWGEVQTHSDGALTVRDAINSPAIFRGDDRKGLAMLALDGMPYGFTRADLDVFLEAAHYAGRDGAPDEFCERLSNLAAKVADLILRPPPFPSPER